MRSFLCCRTSLQICGSSAISPLLGLTSSLEREPGDDALQTRRGFNRDLRDQRTILQDVLPVVGAGLLWRTAARQAVTRSPFAAGTIPSEVAIAYVGTTAGRPRGGVLLSHRTEAHPVTTESIHAKLPIWYASFDCPRCDRPQRYTGPQEANARASTAFLTSTKLMVRALSIGGGSDSRPTNRRRVARLRTGSYAPLRRFPVRRRGHGPSIFKRGWSGQRPSELGQKRAPMRWFDVLGRMTGTPRIFGLDLIRRFVASPLRRRPARLVQGIL